MARATISFKPILPKGKFDAKYYRDEWEKTMRNVVKPDLTRLFKDTTEGWEHKPIFRGTINKKVGALRLLVKATGSNAPLYEMLDTEGAKPHPIKPKNAPALVFQPGYTPATQPRVLSSRRKRRSGPIIRSQFVYHPGFDPREFSKEIALAYQSTYEYEMQKATDKATKALNRSL